MHQFFQTLRHLRWVGAKGDQDAIVDGVGDETLASRGQTNGALAVQIDRVVKWKAIERRHRAHAAPFERERSLSCHRRRSPPPMSKL